MKRVCSFLLILLVAASAAAGEAQRRPADSQPGREAQPRRPGSLVYYPNCDAARAAGAAPIYRGQPGYRPALDRDNDGIACEPWRGRR
ncbi:MAG: excalibur calcium-binding domain-containing protein [Sphingosinicella sp.]|uniref:excalibur calcium-binding domain-containing protein n=1 Tax=Sphingosinicella sp. TaxID=1917971 RepID=UPI0040377C54